MDTVMSLFEHEIQDLYSAEMQIVESMPLMIENAATEKLSEALSEHLEQTQTQVERLTKIAEDLGFEVEGEECQGMNGLVEEGTGMMEEMEESALRDMAIIGAAQRIEHYEMAGYGTAIEHAKLMGHSDAVKLLHKTLEEEEKADKILSEIAEKSVNKEAMEEDEN